MKKKKSLIKKMLLFIGAVGAFAAVGCDSRMKMVHYSIKSSKITHPLKICLVTDLHNTGHGKNQEELIAAIRGEHPDLVLLGGDILENESDNQEGYCFLELISKEYLCYYVSGNHEYWSGDILKMKKQIRSLGIHVLEGDSDEIEIRGQKLLIGGLDDPNSGMVYKMEIKKLKRPGMDEFAILVAHRPERIEEYLPLGYDLMTAGHAHGGQWRIPGLVNGFYAPHQGIFPKYAGGEYQFDKQMMIVSRGLAKDACGIPRIYNRPEVVMIELVGTNE